MKIIFMGTAEFAVPSLNLIFEKKYNIVTVITQPDKKAGRGMKLTPPPVAVAASTLGLPLYQPKSVKSARVLDKIKALKPDLIIVVAYGKLLPNELLDIPPLGCINIHPSLLPKYRGAAPLNWPIINGDKQTGTTIMYINDELDAGDIILQETIDIAESDTTITIHNKLAPMSATLLAKAIEKIKTLKPVPQDPAKATLAPILTKNDGLIDWNKSATEIRNRIRGMQPWPSAYTHLDGKRVRIFDATILDDSTPDKPGTLHLSGEHIVVATSSGKLSINELQLEGKKRMRVQDFLNGHKITNGMILDSRPRGNDDK